MNLFNGLITSQRQFYNRIQSTKQWLNLSNINSEAGNGFTLAEVLITLGIIGVVAALTIPTLVTKYKAKALESGFKKSYAALLNALVPIQNEFYGSFVGSHGGDRNGDLYTSLWKSYKIQYNDESQFVRDVQVFLRYLDIKTNKNLVRDYAGNVMSQYPGCPQIPTQILADGSAVGGMYNCYANWIVFDTNGSGGPNALGHDIFYFGFDSKTKKIRPLGDGVYSYWNYANHDTYCSKDSTDAQNGVGCTYWALKNVCPDNQSKTYWECLP